MKKSHFVWMIVGLMLMFGGPAFGLLTTTLGMIRSYSRFAADGTNDAARLSEGVSRALTGTTVGIVVGAVGLATAVGAIASHFVARRARRKLEAQGMAPLASRPTRAERDAP